MSINWQDIIFNFLGGLGLFLYSIKMMGDGLQQAAGDRLRYFIDKYTSNPILGILVGIGMTALIQSSSGVTVITLSWGNMPFQFSLSGLFVYSLLKTVL